MRARPGGYCAIVVALAFANSACGSPAIRAAEDGDFARLRSEIAGKHQRGALSNGAAAEIASAVAARELATAKTEGSALLRMSETRACAAELDGALADRMKKHDGAGAEAAMVRLEDGKLSAGDARDWLDDADDRWRAVGTWTLVRGADDKRRRAAMLDPSPRVRRSAIRAAARAASTGDLEVLAETARLDPELLLRNEAIRAMSAIVRADSARARDVTIRLRDLWTSGDDAVREDVAVAWALSPVFEAGGREALRTLLATEHGPGALAAAGVVQQTAKNDAELVQAADALIARAIDEGSRRDRLHAIAVARAAGAQLVALRKASKDDDLDVRVPALARLLLSNPDRDAAIHALEQIAGQGARGGGPPPAPSPETYRTHEHASRARLALATAGDRRVQAWIEEDLAADTPARRVSAASALAALGLAARAAPLLADPDPSVRTRAACTILVSARH